jgi:hypothetical protein
MPAVGLEWPAGWEKKRELRPMGTARAFSCRDANGEAALLLFSEREDELARVRQAHDAIDTPHVAKVIEAGDGWLAFRCDAITDFEAIIATGMESGLEVPYPIGIAFNEMMMDTIEAAHRAPSGPYCLGELAWSNILIGPTGHSWIFGFGHDFALRRPAGGAMNFVAGLVQAPEVLLGMKPSPASDVYLIHASLRRLLPYLKILDVLTAAAIGGGRPELRPLRAALIALDEDAQATDPALRPQDVASLRARYREIRRLAKTMPEADDAGLRALVASIAQKSISLSGTRLLVDAESRRVHVPGLAEIDLSRRNVLWRIVMRLVEERRQLPGRAVELDRLQEAAWPGERMLPEAARARVYVAISNLRKLGLGDIIQKRDDGYLVPPEIDI